MDLVQAIEGITQSHYSHVGVLHLRKGKWTVIEACASGVIYTPFEKWKRIGRDERWAAYRLKPKYRPLIPKFLKNLHSHAGKPYDFKYEFTDDKLYCSELVFHAWKKTTHKNMGKIVKIKFNLMTREAPRIKPKNKLIKLFQCSKEKIHWEIINYALSTASNMVTIPLQDILGKSSSGRFNTPGTLSANNWSWRMEEGKLTQSNKNKLAELSKSHRRNGSAIKNLLKKEIESWK